MGPFTYLYFDGPSSWDGKTARSDCFVHYCRLTYVYVALYLSPDVPRNRVRHQYLLNDPMREWVNEEVSERGREWRSEQGSDFSGDIRQMKLSTVCVSQPCWTTIVLAVLPKGRGRACYVVESLTGQDFSSQTLRCDMWKAGKVRMKRRSYVSLLIGD